MTDSFRLHRYAAVKTKKGKVAGSSGRNGRVEHVVVDRQVWTAVQRVIKDGEKRGVRYRVTVVSGDVVVLR